MAWDNCRNQRVLFFVWSLFGAAHLSALFYLLFALAITASVQLVGVYQVFASLIIPALAVRRAGKHAMFAVWLLGVTSYAVGLVVSALLDLPSGSVIVWVLALFGMAGSVLVKRFTAAHAGAGGEMCKESSVTPE